MAVNVLRLQFEIHLFVAIVCVGFALVRKPAGLFLHPSPAGCL